MNRAALLLALSAALAALAAPARAADEDTQLWLYGSAVLPIAPATIATIELSPRFRDAGDQWLMRASGDYKLSPNLSLGGAVAYVESDGAADEFRLHQQAVVTLGPLSFRSRVEERWFDGADRMQIRLRERIAATIPLTTATRVTLAGELLYIARPEKLNASDRVDSWRGQAALQHKLSRHLDGGIGYLLIYSPRSGAADKISHVPQLTLTWRP